MKAKKELTDAITALVEASIADSWKGGGDPNEIPLVEAELQLARVKCELAIARLVMEVEEGVV